MNELKERLPQLIKELETIVPNASVEFKQSSGLHINVNRVQEAIEPENPAKGLVFTLWNGQTFFEYSCNDWTWTDLRGNLMDYARFSAAQVNPSRPKENLDPGPALTRDFSSTFEQNPADLSLDKKLEWARSHLETALSADPQVANASSYLGHVTEESLFVNRAKIISQKIVRSDCMLMVFLSDGQTTCEIFKGSSKNDGLNKVAFTQPVIQELVADGKKLLGAERIKPGVYDVVTDSEWSGIIAHECFGHGMETDLYVRERAMSQRYIGQPIASSIVNMFDDPSIIEEAGGFFFDDEGQISKPTHIIKDGILQRGLTDLASAHKLKLERSANGRRESYARKAYARMTNTFFDNGRTDPEEMIRSIDNGIYLRYATNGMEDPQAWGIQVEGLWAEEIKKGRRTGRVFSPVIMTGFVPDLLKSISLVGNDRYISGLGMCGKGHKEWVKNTTGGPHLKMKARLA